MAAADNDEAFFVLVVVAVVVAIVVVVVVITIAITIAVVPIHHCGQKGRRIDQKSIVSVHEAPKRLDSNPVVPAVSQEIFSLLVDQWMHLDLVDRGHRPSGRSNDLQVVGSKVGDADRYDLVAVKLLQVQECVPGFQQAAAVGGMNQIEIDGQWLLVVVLAIGKTIVVAVVVAVVVDSIVVVDTSNTNGPFVAGDKFVDLLVGF